MQPFPLHSLVKRSRIFRLCILTFLIALILGAIMQSYYIPIPGLHCYFQDLFGFPGPGCGLTRSIMAFLRGDISQALSYHAFGPIIVVVVGWITLALGVETIFNQPIPQLYSWLFKHYWILIFFAVMFSVYYLLRLYLRYGNTPAFLEDFLFWKLLIEGAKAL